MNHRLRFLGTAVVWAFVAITAGVAQESRPADLTTAVDSVIKPAMEQGRIPGAGVAVVLDGVLRLERSYGKADLENAVEVTPESVFRLASISKSLTAVAVMQQVEAGKLGIDDDCRKWCTAFPDKGATITTRLLLTHQSGIRHYRPGEIDSTRHYPNLTQSLDPFKEDALAFAPGTKHGYSTYGYTVLGCVLEAVVGASFPDLMQRNVFARAGMTHSQTDDSHRLIPHRARGYRLRSDGTLENCALADTSAKVAGGGFSSTAGDIARFAIALFDDRLVKAATRQEMWTPQTTRDGRATGYGLGFAVAKRGDHTDVLHTGGQQGTTTVLYMRPDRRAAVVCLTNLEAAKDIAGLGRRLLEACLQAPTSK